MHEEDPKQESDTRRDPFAGPKEKNNTEPTPAENPPSKPPKEKKKDKNKTKEPKIAPTAEPMIIVNVNDRLGTKAAIPCLASDSIREIPSNPFPLHRDTPSPPSPPPLFLP